MKLTSARIGVAMPRASRLALAAIGLVTLIWGYNWVVMKIGLEYAPPFGFAAIRMFLGAVCLFVILILLGRPIRPRGLALTALLGILQTSPAGLVLWALEHEGVGKVSILNYTMPFWLVLMAWIFLGEKLRRLQWLAVALAFIGLLLVLEPWQLHGLVGSLLALISAICWAGSAIVAKVLGKRHEVDLLSVTAWQTLIGSIPLCLVAILTMRTAEPFVWSGPLIIALSFNVVIATALASAAWFFALHHLRAGTTGLATLVIPVIGIVGAWVQLGERPSLGEILGIAIIVGALILIAIWKSPIEPEMQPWD